MDDRELGINTISIHGGDEQNPASAISSPIFQSSTFRFEDPRHIAEAMADKAHPQFYGRYGTPNVRQVEALIAKLESGESALAAASGMGAISLVLLSHLRAGDHLVVQRNIYPTTYNLIRGKISVLGIEVSFVNQIDPSAFESSIQENTKLIYAESPANPTLSLTDLRAISKLARRHNLTSVVDNTFATPYNQRPLKLGCDIVVHSATKYLSGHSDVVGGVIVSTRQTIERLWQDHILLGPILHPFEAWLLGRGLKTFGVRMSRHNENAMAVARFLEDHPKVRRAFYPGLVSHPQHPLAKEQMSGGFGGMVSFTMTGGKEAAFNLLRSLNLVSLATSLGGVDSLISHPQTTVSSVQAEEIRQSVGVDDSLLRLSVGLEDIADIVADLDQALKVS